MTYSETLTRFWVDLACCANAEARIVLISQLAALRFGKRPTKDRNEALRSQMASVKRFRPVECVACWRKPHQRHHLIQLQHGGDNDTRNIVDVCHRCHAMIHPWLSVQMLRAPKERRPPKMRRAKRTYEPWERPQSYRPKELAVNRDMTPRLRARE